MSFGKHCLVLGHGEGDKGAKGVHKYERDYLEDLASEMRTIIAEHGMAENFTIIANRNTYARNEFATNTSYYKQFDSVTDLHLNALNGKGRGACILFGEGLHADDRDMRLFNFLSKVIGWNRWIISDWYQQTRNAKLYGIPSYRLIEYAFCDNPQDEELFVKNIKLLALGTLECLIGQALPQKKPQAVQPKNLKYEVVHPKIEKVAVTTYKDVTKKPHMRLLQDDYLWKIDFTEWSKAESIKKFPKGTEFELADIVTNTLGARYGRTPYSKEHGILNGVNMKVVEIFYK